MLHINTENTIASSVGREVLEPKSIPEALLRVIVENVNWEVLHTRKSENGKLYQTTQSQQFRYTHPETGEQFSITLNVNGSPASAEAADGKLKRQDIAELNAILAGKKEITPEIRAKYNTLLGKF